MWHDGASTAKQWRDNSKHQHLVFERLLAREHFGAAILALTNSMQSLEKAITLEETSTNG
jgi:hypothetical protein